MHCLVLQGPLYDISIPYAIKMMKKVPTILSIWSDECGIKIENIQDLSDTLTQMLDRYITFTPREYILRTLAPKPCMQRILDYFGL